MKSKNIEKDWSGLLREKAGNIAASQPEISFAELKEKMVAAGAVGNTAGASAGGGRRGLSWLKYAAAVAVIGAAGVMLLINPDKNDKGNGLSSSTAENLKDNEVTVVEQPVVEAVPDADAISAAAVEVVPYAGTAHAVKALHSADKGREETVPVDLTKLTAEDVASSAAPSGSLAKSSGNAPGPDPYSDTDPDPDSDTGPDSELQRAEDTATDAAAGAPAGATLTRKQEPAARPLKPVRKQLRRFSIGASGYLAGNGIGNVNLNALNAKSMASDMVTYKDNNGKVFYSFSAPSERYCHSAPISGGISLRYNFSPVFYAETGVRATYLHTWVSPSGAAQDLLYAGIPLGAGASFAHLGNASFYASAYGMLSKCVMGHSSVSFPSNYAQLSDIPLMWSAGASLGASYNITRTFGLFAEPTVSYYFPSSNAPQTIYKENPWYFTLNLGIRFNLN